MAMYHHVTPQSYLRSFADDTNRVCVVEGNEVWRHPRSVRNVGGEDDFYAEAQPAGTTDHHVERNVLRNIDRIGAELLARFRDGELPATDEERSTFRVLPGAANHALVPAAGRVRVDARARDR